jgi:hypothetical protein
VHLTGTCLCLEQVRAGFEGKVKFYWFSFLSTWSWCCLMVTRTCIFMELCSRGELRTYLVLIYLEIRKNRSVLQ